MTPQERAAYVVETNRLAQANHQRALAMFDLVFPPWRWWRWHREHQAVNATMREVRQRMAHLKEQP